jgi:hypothetical protein
MSAHAHKRHAISPRQIKAIHAVIRKLGLDDATYRARLRTYGAHTCKDLSWQQAEELLNSLNGVTSSPCRKAPAGKKYADLDGRPGFATGAQCRLIAAMFAQVTIAEDDDGREKALNSFCARIAKVAGLRMVRNYQVEKIVKALEAMGAEHKEASR